MSSSTSATPRLQETQASSWKWNLAKGASLVCAAYLTYIYLSDSHLRPEPLRGPVEEGPWFWETPEGREEARKAAYQDASEAWQTIYPYLEQAAQFLNSSARGLSNIAVKLHEDYGKEILERVKKAASDYLGT